LEDAAKEAQQRVKTADDELEFLRFMLDRSVTTYTQERRALERMLDEARAKVRELEHRLDQVSQPALSLLEWKTRAIEAESRLSAIRDRLDKPI
jgi:predicted RNase H-like nuclease (RuvC/YqgF family)